MHQKIKQKVRKVHHRVRHYLPFDAWQRWEYKHTTWIIIGLIVFILLLDTSFMTTILGFVGSLAYLGAFLSGLLFVSLFTAVPAVILLLSFADLNILVVALIAALGAMIGDYLILRYVEYEVAYELKPLAYRFGIPQTVGYLQGRKSTLGLVRLLGAGIIASPLPDEIGIGLLGMSKMRRPAFLAVCYLLNVGGILAILVLKRAF